MKIQTNEMTRAALNWAVALAEGWTQVTATDNYGDYLYLAKGDQYMDPKNYRPTTNWAEGGPIIAREKISVGHQPSAPDGSQWYATNRQGAFGISDAPLIAAMRCYVAIKLGDEVDVPEELK